jgi:hypothetical protein
MRTKWTFAAICGCVSGILSVWLLGVVGNNALVWLPGAMFGWMFTCYIMCATPTYQPSHKYLRWALFIGLSTAAYYSAVFVFATCSNQFGSDKSKIWFLGMIAGFVGSLILILSIWLCSFRIPSWRHAILTIVLGAAFGSLIGYNGKLAAYPLFVLWQTVVFVGLISSLPRDFFRKVEEPKGRTV